jgi:HEAT repeat protein
MQMLYSTSDNDFLHARITEATMTERIIPFDGQERLLTKARSYLSAMDVLIHDGDQGVEALLKAFPIADEDLKLKIVIMLGTFARSSAAWSLLAIMRDPSQVENVRQAAAIQISVIGAAFLYRDELAEQLRLDLENVEPFMRARAAFALGWEGNLRATPDLIDCLADEDIEVQQAAVNALSNLCDESLFTLLAQRLQRGAKEQQRSILYNLSHFPSRHGDGAKICRTFLHHNDPDLRYDALVVLHSLSDPVQDLDLYGRCLDDTDGRIRELALLRLQAIQRSRLQALLPAIRRMVRDPQSRVRQAATRLVHHIDPLSLAKEG